MSPANIFCLQMFHQSNNCIRLRIILIFIFCICYPNNRIPGGEIMSILSFDWEKKIELPPGKIDLPKGFFRLNCG